MKIILTGTGGLLGRHITAELQKNSSYEIIAATSDPHKLENTYADCKNVYVVSNNELFQRDWDYGKADIWINCLYPMSYDGRSIADGLRLISDMLKIIPEHVDYCIDISSQSVYDCKRLEPASEQSPISLSDSYAVGKYTIEQLFDARCGNKCVHIRLASLIGADFERRFINKFIDKVLNNEDINISGGSQLFGFMDVRDAADGIVMMVNAINNSNTSPLTPIWGGGRLYTIWGQTKRIA